MIENKDTTKRETGWLWVITYGYNGEFEPSIICRTEKEAEKIRATLEAHKFDIYAVDEVRISTPGAIEGKFQPND